VHREQARSYRDLGDFKIVLTWAKVLALP